MKPYEEYEGDAVLAELIEREVTIATRGYELVMDEELVERMRHHLRFWLFTDPKARAILEILRDEVEDSSGTRVREVSSDAPIEGVGGGRR